MFKKFTTRELVLSYWILGTLGILFGFVVHRRMSRMRIMAQLGGLTMFERFTTKQLVFLALMGAVLFLQDISISIPIYAATGIPGAGYAIIGITFVLVAIVGALVVPRFGSFTIMAFIYSVIAIPTPVYGPPACSRSSCQ